jgi:hypothetical protein
MRRMLSLLLPLCLLLAAAASQASTLDRDRDPVLLTGADLPSLVGLAPSAVVAFRYQGGWVQIPVQIDERDTASFNQVYGGGYPQGEIDVETYTDVGSYVGPDSDPLLGAAACSSRSAIPWMAARASPISSRAPAASCPTPAPTT